MEDRLTDTEASGLLKILLNVQYAFFSYEEKMAIIQMLDLVIFADGKADKKELKWMDMVINQFGLKWDHLDAAIKLDHKGSIVILNAMDANKKTLFKEIVLKMATIDGNVTVQEKQVLELMFNMVGI